jgi:hypothetical protein
MDIQKHDPMYHEQSFRLADAPNSVPSWDREALILKIQIIDSCTRTEARRQVNDMAVGFSQLAGPPFSSRPRDREATPTAPVYVRYRTDYSKLSRWPPRTNVLPLMEPGRT